MYVTAQAASKYIPQEILVKHIQFGSCIVKVLERLGTQDCTESVVLFSFKTVKVGRRQIPWAKRCLFFSFQSVRLKAGTWRHKTPICDSGFCTPCEYFEGVTRTRCGSGFVHLSNLYWICSWHLVCFSTIRFQMLAPFGFPSRCYCQVFDPFSCFA